MMMKMKIKKWIEVNVEGKKDQLSEKEARMEKLMLASVHSQAIQAVRAAGQAGNHIE